MTDHTETAVPENVAPEATPLSAVPSIAGAAAFAGAESAEILNLLGDTAAGGSCCGGGCCGPADESA